MLAIFIAISQTFIDGGFGTALVRKIERTEEDYSTVFIINLCISVGVTLILILVAPLIASFYKMPILCPILKIQSVTLIVYALMAVQVSKLTAELNFKALAKSTILAALFSGIIGIIVAYIYRSVWALVVQNILHVTINCICVIIYSNWYPKTGFSKQSFNDLFAFGKNMLGASLLTNIYNNIDSLVIGKFYTSADLGNYARGTSIAKLPVSNINGVLAKVTYPIFSKLQNETERLIHTYRKYIKISSMCIFFCCCLLAALGKPLVFFLLTEKWEAAIIFLQIYSFSIMVDHLCSINLSLIKVKGRSDLVLKLEIVKRVISFGILLAAIPFGVLGICISKIIYSHIAVFINTYYNGKLFGLGYYSQLKDYIKYFVISIIVCIPSYLLTFLNLPNVLLLTVGCSLSAVMYYLILRHDECMVDLVELTRNKFLERK